MGGHHLIQSMDDTCQVTGGTSLRTCVCPSHLSHVDPQVLFLIRPVTHRQPQLVLLPGLVQLHLLHTDKHTHTHTHSVDEKRIMRDKDDDDGDEGMVMKMRE